MSAEIYFNDAIKKYNSIFKFINKNSYNEEALELFVKAKNIYIINKNYSRVVECYEWIIKCSLELKDSFFNEINKYYEEYGLFLLQKSMDHLKGIDMCNKAIAEYTLDGKFNNIISLKEKLAEYYKKELNYKETIKLYNDIKDLSVESKYKSDRIMKELYELYIQDNDFENAFSIIDESITTPSNNLLGKYNLTNLIFDAVLCYIIIDKEMAGSKFDQYCNNYPSITNSRQYKLLNQILDSLDTNNIEMFEDSLRSYDSLSTLSNIHIKLLSKIKENFNDLDPNSLC
ncbi:soluble N-ethylmaleimide-sensitive factor [Fadolivirus algeromassiliense]|jgi:alpha-soluble NSF attachment protein|uniref:Soluble N-ethylmaleimide-sensitive factor n=1 Tax=Fadolivirus FV1/VV64 TaxID=3070911 RepID=A0A7D3QTY1_9VIRU|nr:soluble N-ethylmaleimide-sensitive factor [Fadolivirus algeromassiliense]QKF93707.1 soluble N-ethylmaleimide-sensitive factor [Fadolivirus FV1/VV64]